VIDPILYPVMGISTCVSLVTAIAIALIQKRRGKTSHFLRYFLIVFIVCLLAFLSIPPTTIVGIDTTAFTSIATATESPTLAPKDADALQPVISLLQTNGNCRLPCWWGLKPKLSTISDIRPLLRKSLNREPEAPFIRQDGLIDYYLKLSFIPQDEPSLYLTFTTDRDLLVRTEVVFSQPNSWLSNKQWWEPAQLLQHMGQPTNIYITISPSTKSFALYIVFNDKGILVQYIVDFKGDQFSEESNSILLCPRVEQISYTKMWLEDKAVDMMASHLLRNPSRPTSEYFPTLKATTGLEISAFTKLLAAEPEACIKALAHQK
jgi:hypothetical protein